MSIRTVMLSTVVALVTLAPTAVVTAAPASAAAKPLATRVFHGTGDTVVRMGIGHHSVLVVVTSKDPHGVLVQPLSRGDVEGASLVYSGHAYSGTKALVTSQYTPAVTGFTIRTDGAWTIKVKPISAAPLWHKGAISGHGDTVFRLSPALKKITPARMVFSSDAVTAFMVQPYVHGVGAGFVVSFAGTHINKRVLLPVGTDYLAISADGAWRISR